MYQKSLFQQSFGTSPFVFAHPILYRFLLFNTLQLNLFSISTHLSTLEKANHHMLRIALRKSIHILNKDISAAK